MVKRLLTDNEYTITSTTTIVIDGSISFEHKNIGLIIVTVDNNIVYNFACDDVKCTVVGSIITLVDKEIETTDSLTIVLQFEEGSDLEQLKETTLWNKRQEALLKESLEVQTETLKYIKKLYNPE
jgi:hypothetical protein